MSNMVKKRDVDTERENHTARKGREKSMANTVNSEYRHSEQYTGPFVHWPPGALEVPVFKKSVTDSKCLSWQYGQRWYCHRLGSQNKYIKPT